MFQRNRTSELVVKPRLSSRSKLIVTALIGLGLLLSAGSIYNYGLTTAGFKRLLATEKEGTLNDQIDKLSKENKELQAALARSERTLQMDQTAYKGLDRQLKGSAREITKLRGELNFYRNIISPSNKKSGLRIQSLALEKTDKKSSYRYKLVLIQALTHDRNIRGNAKLEVSGMQAGKATTLSYPTARQKAIRINFRYFQDVTGKIELPGNFEPREIKIKVNTRGRGGQSVEQVYPWRAVQQNSAYRRSPIGVSHIG